MGTEIENDLEAATEHLFLRELHRRVAAAVPVAVEGQSAVPPRAGRGGGPSDVPAPASATRGGGGAAPLRGVRSRGSGRLFGRHAHAVVEATVPPAAARGAGPDDLEPRAQDALLRHLDVGVHHAAAVLVVQSPRIREGGASVVLPACRRARSIRTARQGQADRLTLAHFDDDIAAAAAAAAGFGLGVILHAPGTRRVHDLPPPRHLLRGELHALVVVAASPVVKRRIVLATWSTGLGIPRLRPRSDPRHRLRPVVVIPRPRRSRDRSGVRRDEGAGVDVPADPPRTRPPGRRRIRPRRRDAVGAALRRDLPPAPPGRCSSLLLVATALAPNSRGAIASVARLGRGERRRCGCGADAVAAALPGGGGGIVDVFSVAHC